MLSSEQIMHRHNINIQNVGIEVTKHVNQNIKISQMKNQSEQCEPTGAKLCKCQPKYAM